MTPRHSGMIEPHVASRIAADNVIAGSKDKRAVFPHKPTTCLGLVMVVCRAAEVCRLRAKCITNTMCCSDELPRLRILIDRFSNFADKHVQVAFDDKRVGPYLAEQVRL